MICAQKGVIGTVAVRSGGGTAGAVPGSPCWRNKQREREFPGGSYERFMNGFPSHSDVLHPSHPATFLQFRQRN